jgi:hypothetical protein
MKKNSILLIILAICLSTNACNACKFDFGDRDRDKREWTLKIVPIGGDNICGDDAFFRFKLLREGPSYHDCKVEKVQLEVITSNDTAIEVQEETGGYPEVYTPIKDKKVKIKYLSPDGCEQMLKVYLQPGYETVDLGKVTIELKFLYDCKPLENADSKHTFYWKPTNPVEKKLFNAIEGGDLHTIKTILGSDEKNQITGNAHNKARKTILYAAAYAYEKNKYTAIAYCDLISQLLNIAGIEVNNQCAGNTFSTKFFLEYQLGENDVPVNVIQMLLDKNATVRAEKTKLNACLQSLYSFSTNKQLEKLDLLLSRFPGEINEQDEYGNTPLHIPVLKVHENNIQAIERLKAKGASWNITNKEGKSSKELAIAAMQKFCKEKHITYGGTTGSGSDWDLYKKFEQTCGS